MCLAMSTTLQKSLEDVIPAGPTREAGEAVFVGQNHQNTRCAGQVVFWEL